MTMLIPGKLDVSDMLRLASHGLRARPLRVILSALGIAIGIAAMVAVVGISSSSRAELNRMLDALGTNLLRVQPGTTFFGGQATLPDESIAMIGRLIGVQSVGAVGLLTDAKVYRHHKIPSVRSGGIGTYAAHIGLLETLGVRTSAGIWLNEATARYPVVVLGNRAASRLGLASGSLGAQIWLGGRWFTVVGILEPVVLASSLDLGAFVGWPAAESYLGSEAEITTVYVRTDPDSVNDVRALLARTANPEQPNEADVSRPSDALAAQAAADLTFTGLLLGLGSVALLVGGIGVVNTMVISVLERRAEIGLRRSQGATRGHIRAQFFSEALLLAGLGGGVGILAGIGVTVTFTVFQSWPFSVPLWVIAGAMMATLVVGSVGGLYPAIRAADLAPTEALSST